MYLLLNRWEHEGKKGTEQVFCFVLFCFVYNKYYIMYSWLNWRLADFLSPGEVFLQRRLGSWLHRLQQRWG